MINFPIDQSTCLNLCIFSKFLSLSLSLYIYIYICIKCIKIPMWWMIYSFQQWWFIRFIHLFFVSSNYSSIYGIFEFWWKCIFGLTFWANFHFRLYFFGTPTLVTENQKCYYFGLCCYLNNGKILCGKRSASLAF